MRRAALKKEHLNTAWALRLCKQIFNLKFIYGHTERKHINADAILKFTHGCTRVKYRVIFFKSPKIHEIGQGVGSEFGHIHFPGTLIKMYK